MSSRITTKFGREWQHRRLMFRSMTTSLVLHGQIETTMGKARELRKFADRMISFSKKGTAAARRQAGSFLTTRQAVSKLFNDYCKRFYHRPGGYTRLRPCGFRRGDRAPMAVIEFINDDSTMKPCDYVVKINTANE